LSNAGGKWIYETLSEEDIKLFDEIILSCELKMIKPEPEIYRFVSQKLGVNPSECLYVDDIKRYCDGAEVVGMQAILFKDTNQFIDDVKARLKRD
jgi:epoxide hydrolase-like predicted phosphatase